MSKMTQRKEKEVTEAHVKKIDINKKEDSVESIIALRNELAPEMHVSSFPFMGSNDGIPPEDMIRTELIFVRTGLTGKDLVQNATGMLQPGWYDIILEGGAGGGASSGAAVNPALSSGGHGARLTDRIFLPEQASFVASVGNGGLGISGHQLGSDSGGATTLLVGANRLFVATSGGGVTGHGALANAGFAVGGGSCWQSGSAGQLPSASTIGNVAFNNATPPDGVIPGRLGSLVGGTPNATSVMGSAGPFQSAGSANNAASRGNFPGGGGSIEIWRLGS